MSRIACVNVPALPLQLLLKRNPAWIDHPMCVVEHDEPSGRVLWVNQRAWDDRIRPGMRYAAALSLSAELRAGVVATPEVEEVVDDLARALQRFTPSIEAYEERPGVFWLDADGLGRLYASLDDWTRQIEQVLAERDYRATVVVGFQRFAAYALALARARPRVIPDPDSERRTLLRVPLERLEPDDALLTALERLGLRTLGQLVRMRRAEVTRKLGENAARLHRMATEGMQLPVQARQSRPDFVREIELGYPERDTNRILFRLKSVLPGLVGELLRTDDMVAEIRLDLELERRAGQKQGDEGRLEERIRPSAPTLDEALILDLLRLRLDALPLASGITRVCFSLIPTRIVRRQASLLEGRPKRDLAAAGRALARLRAELGDEAVGVLRLDDGHLPEARARWTPMHRLRRAAPNRPKVRPLVRRMNTAPLILPPRPSQEPDGWLVRGPESGPVVRSVGPHIISGGWWATEVHREYHFLETGRGHLLWTFYDRRRRRWFLHGTIE